MARRIDDAGAPERFHEQVGIACLGAYLHGLAADLAAENAVGTEGMVASDLFQFLPAAVERLKSGPQEEAHEHH